MTISTNCCRTSSKVTAGECWTDNTILSRNRANKGRRAVAHRVHSQRNARAAFVGVFDGHLKKQCRRTGGGKKWGRYLRFGVGTSPGQNGGPSELNKCKNKKILHWVSPSLGGIWHLIYAKGPKSVALPRGFRRKRSRT